LSEHEAEDVLGRLAESGWASRTDEGDWVLTRAPGQILLAEIIRRFALDSGAWRRAAGGDSNLARSLEGHLRLDGQTLAELARDRQAQQDMRAQDRTVSPDECG
jgi:membrane protein